MGGQSLKCPYCKEWWTLELSSLKGHLKDKHAMPKAEMEMSGPFVKSITFDYCGVRCTEVI